MRRQITIVSLEAFHKLWGTSFKSKVLNQEDREVVMLAASQFNNCLWCVKVHCLLGSTMNIEEHDLNETAKGGLPAATSERHRIIAMATRKILSKKGALSEDDKAFYRKHGLEQTELQEILSTAMIMCFANYSNHLNQVAENQDDIQDATNQLTKALNINDNFVATHAI